MPEYCPTCIVELSTDHKKLGPCKNWLICPNCGYRIKNKINTDDSEFEFIERRKALNSNNYFHEKE